MSLCFCAVLKATVLCTSENKEILPWLQEKATKTGKIWKKKSLRGKQKISINREELLYNCGWKLKKHDV